MPSSIHFGSPTIRFDTIDSTNRVALIAASEGASEGTVFVGDTQTAGRGRRSRKWHSPPGLGLYFSLLLRPNRPVLGVNNLVLQSAVAVCEAIDSAVGVNSGIKWPNDIYLAGKKVGGILLETTISGGLVRTAVIGIGINMRHRLQDLPEDLREKATSIKEEAGVDIQDQKLMELILSTYEDYYYGRKKCGISNWEAKCIHMNQTVNLENGNFGLSGLFKNISEDLSFQLMEQSSKLHKIEFGELSLNMEN